ncbi:MAG: protoporphyrinogen oxidase HemJ [Alphaproteobacteria bacterium]|nr:protoporphyrinogen oxidase HemJ [Alphaproteobacteria bacterium]
MRQTLLAIYPWIKALHVIAVIAWMAGMMYLPRLFVYHWRAEKGGEAERNFIQMERRLLKGIINPAMIAVWVLGLTMLYANPALLHDPWLHVKLAAVLSISAVHGLYAGAQRRFARGERPRTEKFWRIMNEVPFLLMMIAVIMVIVRPF